MERAESKDLSKLMSLSIAMNQMYVLKYGDKEIEFPDDDQTIEEGHDGSVYARPFDVVSVDFVTKGAATGDMGLRSAETVVETVDQINVEDNNKNILFKSYMKKETLDIVKAYNKPEYILRAAEMAVDGKTDEEILSALSEEEKIAVANAMQKAMADKIAGYENTIKTLTNKLAKYESEASDKDKVIGEYSAKITELSDKFKKIGTDPIELGEKNNNEPDFFTALYASSGQERETLIANNREKYNKFLLGRS
jgi:dihydroxyacetone kinase-like predicted kinase